MPFEPIRFKPPNLHRRQPLQHPTNSITRPLSMGRGEECPSCLDPQVRQMVAEVQEVVLVLVLTPCSICHVMDFTQVRLEGLQLGHQIANKGIDGGGVVFAGVREVSIALMLQLPVLLPIHHPRMEWHLALAEVECWMEENVMEKKEERWDTMLNYDWIKKERKKGMGRDEGLSWQTEEEERKRRSRRSIIS